MIIPEAALNQHIAIIGKTGSGKSYAAKGIVERLLKSGRQVCVVDPTAAWWGLRLGADGKSRGFDVVLLGGRHADIPLAPRSGEAVARLVTQQHASAVIDTSGLSVGEFTQWFIDFAGTLYTTVRDPLHVVIDEAHNFMPQGRVPDPQAGKMLHAGNRLMSGGRSLGIRGLLITQRPAKIHKDALTCADTLIAMRVIAPQDREAVRAWVDGAGDPVQGKTVIDSLAGLSRGEGWVWYPEGNHLQRVTFPKITTYDSSATPTHGAKAGPKVSEIKLDEVRSAMAEAVKEAEANDPKLLRAEIARLKKEQKTAAPAQADPKAIERAVTAAVASRDREWQQSLKEHGRIIENLKGRMGKAAALLSVNGEATPTAIPRAPSMPSAAPSGREHSRTDGERSRSAAEGVRTLQNSPAAHSTKANQTRQKAAWPSPALRELQLGKAERAILTALYWLRDEDVTPAKVGFYADYTAGSGSFNNALGRLRSSGLLQGWKITEEGISTAEELGAEAKPTGQDLRDWLRRKLGKAENALLDALCEAYPNRLTDEELGPVSGYTSGSGSFNNALGRLRSIEAAEGYARDGGTKASDVFFE